MTESTDVFVLRACDPAGTEARGVIGHLTTGTLRTAWIGGSVLWVAASWVLVVGIATSWAAASWGDTSGRLVVGVGEIWVVDVLLVVASSIGA